MTPLPPLCLMEPLKHTSQKACHLSDVFYLMNHCLNDGGVIGFHKARTQE